LRAVIGGGLYLAVLGLLGLGLGTIIRHTAGAISAFVALSLLLPWIVAQYLPNSASNAVSKWLPANIGVAITSARPHAHEFSPVVGFGILCAYAALILICGAWLMNTRDA
jgi:ABC-2 type transport system permease protein